MDWKSLKAELLNKVGDVMYDELPEDKEELAAMFEALDLCKELIGRARANGIIS